MKRVLLVLGLASVVAVSCGVSTSHADPLPACNVSVATLNPPAGVSLNCSPYTTATGQYVNGFDYTLVK